MSDEIAEVTESQPVKVVGPKDWFLRLILELCQNTTLEIGVTVFVSGTVISGTLISEKTYFHELSERMKTNVTGSLEVANTLGDAWKEFGQISQKPDDAPEDWEAPSPRFLHLRNAKVFAPGQQPLPNGIGLLWRGKLGSIDGFSLGNFSAD